MSFFNGANNVDPSSKLPFFPTDFIGRVKVDSCKGITQRDGTRAFIAEMTVLSSNLPNVYVNGRYSWFQSLKEPGTAYPACIGFLYACLGLDPARDKAKIEQVKPKQDDYLNQAVSDKNILGGAEINLQTSTKMTKAKKEFTLHAFSPTV